MKKSWFILALACSLLLSACGGESGGIIPDTGSNSQSSSSLGGSGDSSSGGGSGGAQSSHVDKDEDGVCDDCQESVVVTLDFLSINDLHGKFDDEGESIGVDELSTYFANAKTENPNTVLLSAGDMWQGGGVSNITEGKIVTEWMNAMGFTSMSMGNHEYDWSREAIETNAELANFPLLAINLYDEATYERVDYCDASVMVEMSGVQVGIIGAIGDCETSIAANNREGLIFKTGNELTSLVKAESDSLRAKGADFIVYTIHGDYRETGEYDLSLSNGYVDLVFEAHTHQMYCQKDSYGVYHVQGGGENSGLSHAKVRINSATGRVLGVQADNVRSSAYASLDDHPIVAELMEKYKEEIATVKDVLGYNDTLRYSGELARTSAKLYYEAGVKKWGDDFDILLGGGNINVRAPYELTVGDVTFGNLIDLFPFDNALVLCSVKGSDVKARFYDEGNAYYCYDGGFGKENIQDDETYYIVTDKWNSPFAANKLTEIAVYDDTTFARHLLADYIRQGGFGTKPVESTTVSISIAEALAIGGALQPNETTDTVYRVQGEIIDIEPTHSSGIQYGNMTIKAASGETLYIYGTVDAAGTRYGDLTDKPQVGDYITLEQKITRYVRESNGVVVTDKVELNQAVIVDFVSLTSIADVLSIGNGLEVDEVTTEFYYIKGTVGNIKSTKWGNLYLQDGNGAEVYVYGLYDDKGNKYDAMSVKPQTGDTIVVYAQITKYKTGDGTLIVEVIDAVLYAIE